VGNRITKRYWRWSLLAMNFWIVVGVLIVVFLSGYSFGKERRKREKQ